MRLRRFLVKIALAIALVAGPAAYGDLKYRAEITGAEDSEFADLLDSVSELKTLEDKPPASEEALRRRADRDLERLADAAHSLGYWDAEFSYDVNTETETALLGAYGDSGHPFAKVDNRRVEIDRDTRTMEVTYTLDPGPVMRFGPPEIVGLERLDPDYVQGRIRWQRGEIYDARQVEETRRALIESGLFSTVRITPTLDPQNPEDARMTIETTERLHRTIGAGVAYNTSQGIGARAFWENRNLFGGAEYLRLSAEVGQQIDAFRANFRRPDFLAIEQDFLATAEVANDEPVAYHSRRAIATVGLERRFDHLLTGGVALEAAKANVVQLANTDPFIPAQQTQHYTLVGVPAYVKLDKTDNLLNPTTGYRAQLAVTPARTFSGSNLTFVTNLLSGSTYWGLGSEQRTILAGKLALGSLVGAPLS